MMRETDSKPQAFRPTGTEDLNWRMVFRNFVETVIFVVELERFPFSFYRDKWFGHFDRVTRALVFYGVQLSFILGVIVIEAMVDRLQVSAALAIGSGILTCLLCLLLVRWVVRREYP